MISEIYQGKVTNWNDSAIASLNPGVTLPSLPIVTLHRSDSSGDTFLFTSFLSDDRPQLAGANGRLQHHRHLARRPGRPG